MSAEARCWHFGVLSTSGAGHLNPFIALSQELTRRGHEVTFFGRPKIDFDVRQAGFNFVPLGTEAASARREPGTSTPTIRDEIAAIRFRLVQMCADIELYLAEAPTAITRAGVNALLVDEIVLTGPTVAQLVDLPYFLIATSVPHHLGWKYSSWFSGHRRSRTWLSSLQSTFLEQSVLRTRGRVRGTLDDFRRTAGLGPIARISRDFSCLAHITQLPRCLEPPRRKARHNLYYAGPLINRYGRPHVPFPWEQLDGRPIVYASLGTTKNVQPAVLRMIAEACHGLGVQLVMSLGNRFATEEFANMPGGPIVVRYAPQLELLKRATVVITHGGSNTVFETLVEGKPMVVIPLAFDQPAMAVRLRSVGVVEVLSVMHLSPRRIRRALAKVLGEKKYKESALRVQSELKTTFGVDCAAKIVEDALEAYVREHTTSAGIHSAVSSRMHQSQMPGLPALQANDSSRSIASFRSQ